MQDLKNYTVGYYTRERPENLFTDCGLLRPDELAALCYALDWPFWGPKGKPIRNPGKIYSIGAGPGNLEVILEKMGHEVVGVDPSPGAKELYQGKKLVDKYDGGGDTILFVESIEHLPVKEINRIMSLVPHGARVVIVNWVDFFPIPKDSEWDHITTIDDGMYDKLTKNNKVVLRKGSHLVFEKCSGQS